MGLLPGALLLATLGFPRVEYQYASVFDATCAESTGSEVPDAWVTALEGKLPSWQALWDRRGTEALRKTVELTGKGFRQQSTVAALFLCQKWPSMSLPTLIKANFFLDGPTGGRPESADLLVGTTFHELLHHFVDENLGARGATPLLRKYAAESVMTRNHLHLYAVLFAVYESLGWRDELEALKEWDAPLGPNGDYRRAMQIVEKEGSAPFLAELSGAR